MTYEVLSVTSMLLAALDTIVHLVGRGFKSSACVSKKNTKQ